MVLRDSAGDVGVMDLEPPEADMLLGRAPIEPARLALWQELGMVQPSSWPLQSHLSQPEE